MDLDQKYSIDHEGDYGLFDDSILNRGGNYYKYLGKIQNEIHVVKHYKNINWTEYNHIIFLKLETNPEPQIRTIALFDESEGGEREGKTEVNIYNNLVGIEWFTLRDEIYKLLTIDFSKWKTRIVITPHDIEQGKYIYTGNINGANVEAQLEFEGKDISGHYSYDRYKKFIKLNGSINGISEFSINESFEGKNTGNLSGTYISKGKLSGFWSSPAKKKSLPFKLTRINSKFESSFSKIEDKIWTVKGVDILPTCLRIEWPSSDNYDEYRDQFPSATDFHEYPGKYWGDLVPIEPLNAGWGEPVSLPSKASECNGLGPGLKKEIDANFIEIIDPKMAHHEDQNAYRLLAEWGKEGCSSAVPAFADNCQSLVFVEMNENTRFGRSKNSYAYITHSGEDYILPVTNDLSLKQLLLIIGN